MGDTMRNGNRNLLLQKILHSARGPSRRRISWLKNFRTWFNQSTTHLFKALVNKIKIAIMIANIRSG